MAHLDLRCLTFSLSTLHINFFPSNKLLKKADYKCRLKFGTKRAKDKTNATYETKDAQTKNNNNGNCLGRASRKTAETQLPCRTRWIILQMYPFPFTLSSLQTNTDTFANSADLDETARIEPSHLDLHFLPFYI